MNRITKCSVVVLASTAVIFSSVAGVSAQPTTSKNSATKIIKPITKVVPAKTKAQKAAAKRLAAKKAAAKKAAAKRLAAKKAAAKRLAAKKAAAKKVADQTRKASRKALLNDILNSLTPNPPSESPSPDPNQSGGPDSQSGEFSGSMPIFCPPEQFSREYRCGDYGPRIGKPTAQLYAFQEAMKSANTDYFLATQAAYQAYESATSEASDTFNRAWVSAFDSSPSSYMQSYLDYLAATREAQNELNALTLAANQALTEAKFVALADFDAASYDATTEVGASALSAIYDYRKATKALELEQYAKNLSDSAELTDGIFKRMQTYLDLIATLTSEEDLNAASDAYYADLTDLYLGTSITSNDYLKPFYEAVQTAQDTFVTLTGDVPARPDYYPYWYFGGEYPNHPIDPLPPEDGDSGDSDDTVYCLSLDCPKPDRPMPTDPTVPDDQTGEPEIIICPPAPPEFFEEIPEPEVSTCQEEPKEIDSEYPTPVPDESDNSDQAGGSDDSGTVVN